MEQSVVSVKYSEAQQTIHSHFHDAHQLIYVVKGSANVTVSGKKYLAQAGTLVLVSRLESHAIQNQSGDYSRYTVQISPDIYGYSSLLGENLFSLLVNRPKQFRHAVDMSDCPQIEPLLKAMAEESSGNGPMQDKMLLFMLCQILVLCCRMHPMQVPDDAQRLQLASQVQRYIEENFQNRITLQTLAEQFHLSQSYLSHLFKRITGCSVIGYLNAYRLIVARHYLVETDWEISRIVEACGFSDNSNFSRTFKNTTGDSPSTFRSKFKKTGT